MFSRLCRLVFAIALWCASPTHAATDAQQCIGSKLDATASTLGAMLRCEARAAVRGTAPDPACTFARFTRLVAAFDRVETRGGCAGTGDAATVHATLVDVVASSVSALVATGAASSCAGAKLRAIALAVDRTLACHGRTIRRGATEPEAACTEAAATRLSSAFARAEHRRDCATQDDASLVADAIAAQAAALVALVAAGTPPADGPSALAATIEGGVIHLTWRNADPVSGSTYARLLRRLNAPPADASDPAADVVFFGASEGFDDNLTALLPDTAETPRTYHYAVFGCTAAGACEGPGSRSILAPTVSEALSAGGYVMHWRHAAADVCSDRTDLGTAASTSVPDWWKSCDAQCPPEGTATARQLNATGVAQSIAIGEALRARGIPVGRVVSSEFCRNVGTAELMAFGPAIEESPLITFFVYDEPARCQNSYALLSELPAAGTNTALIGHAGFSCAVLGMLAWGEAAIFKPDGAGGSEFVTRVYWDGWLDLP
jgi:phosphohistidine phosphatase SixA